MDTWYSIAFWIGFTGCVCYIIDAVVLWHHRPALVFVAFPLAVVLITAISLLEITRSWLGLLSWLLAVATIGITIASLEYVGFKKKKPPVVCKCKKRPPETCFSHQPLMTGNKYWIKEPLGNARGFWHLHAFKTCFDIIFAFLKNLVVNRFQSNILS